MFQTIRRDEVSWGALALILCLALPMGILSRFAPRTTADEVDAAESVVVARVTAMQTVRDAGFTLLQFEVDHAVLGADPGRRFELRVDGHPVLEVGDLVLTMLSFDPPSLHGAYQVRKNPVSLDYEVLTSVTGLSAEGIYDMPPISVGQFEDAIRLRRGLGPIGASRSGSAAKPAQTGTPIDGEGEGDGDGEDEDADDSEDDLSGSARGSSSTGPSKDKTNQLAACMDGHGNSIATATPVQLKLPHPMLGMPTLITGCLVPGDVDYFSFQAPVLSLLHAQTQMPEGLTSIPPDTIMGLFNGFTGELLDYDDDSGTGNLSSFVVPIEETAMYAVAVEGAPDPGLTFTGADGDQTGPYVLSLELQQASYLSNFLDLIVGVSPDGTFIQDYVGFKRVNGVDVLRGGLEADGWGIEFDVQLPTGPKHAYGGSGDFLVQPGFTDMVSRSVFSLGWVGDNRRGRAMSQTTLPYQTGPLHSVSIQQSYNVQLMQSTVRSNLILEVANTDRIKNIEFRRLMDVDLFDVGDDTFYWSFDPGSAWLVYPTDLTGSLDALVAPSMSSGQMTGDLQVAIVAGAGTIDGASFQNPQSVRFPLAFTLVDQFVSKQDAVQSAVQNLLASDTESWTVAVDVDPSTGLYTAFGVGLGEPIR